MHSNFDCAYFFWDIGNQRSIECSRVLSEVQRSRKNLHGHGSTYHRKVYAHDGQYVIKVSVQWKIYYHEEVKIHSHSKTPPPFGQGVLKRRKMLGT